MEKGFYEFLLDFTIHMAQEVFDHRVSQENLSTWDLYEMREELDLLYNMKITEWPTLVRLSMKYTIYMLNQDGVDELFLKSHLYNLKRYMCEYYESLQENIKETKEAIESLNKYYEKIRRLQKTTPQEHVEKHDELKQIERELSNALDYYELALEDLTREECMYEYFCS